MSSGRGRDIRYGRRGGGWIDEPRRPTSTPTPLPTAPPSGPVQPALFNPAPASGETDPAESDLVHLDAAELDPSAGGELSTRRVVLDPERLFHPATIAAHRAHVRHCGGRPHAGGPCPAMVEPSDLEAVWSGRARMARARRAAGVALDAADRAALARVALVDMEDGRA